jgi:4-amino-4-deoxy-L-arabinose transferase-like glycosyltransferase
MEWTKQRNGPVARGAGRHAWLLAGVVALALCLRIWGISFGLPYLYHPDEPTCVAIAQTMFKTGDWNPHFFHYPSLFLYLHALAYVPYLLVGRMLGALHAPLDIAFPVRIAMGCGFTPMSTTFLMGRSLTVLFATGTGLLTYRIGRRLSGSWQVGLLAACLLAVSPTDVGNSRLIAPDALVVFFVLTSFWGTVLLAEEGKPRYYLLAGLAAGLAASTKYNGALILLPLVVAHLLRCGRKGLRDRSLYLALGMSVLAFFVTTPYSILDSAAFLNGLRFDAQHYATGHPGMEGNTLWWYLSYMLTVEGPLVVLAAAQILRGLHTRSKNVILVSVFPVTYFVFISRYVVRNARTLLILMPFLCLLAAFLLVEALHRLRDQQTRRRVLLGILLTAVGLATLVVPLWHTVRDNLRLTMVDGRETARAYIDSNCPLRSKIAVESYSPFVNPQRFVVQGFGRITDHALEWYVAEGFDYLVFSAGMFERFYRDPLRYADEVRQYEAFFRTLVPERIFLDGGYEVRLYCIRR